MKRRVLSFLAGAAAALALTALTATALAASGQVQFNFAGVALRMLTESVYRFILTVIRYSVRHILMRIRWT